jgi:hypothetical protein
VTANERPVRTVGQVAAALFTTDLHALELMQLLEIACLAEEAHGGWRATEDAWRSYPRPQPKKRAA